MNMLRPLSDAPTRRAELTSGTLTVALPVNVIVVGSARLPTNIVVGIEKPL
jgi:hypothetical protein